MRDLFALGEGADWSWREQTVDESEKVEAASGGATWDGRPSWSGMVVGTRAVIAWF